MGGWPKHCFFGICLIVFSTRVRGKDCSLVCYQPGSVKVNLFQQKLHQYSRKCDHNVELKFVIEEGKGEPASSVISWIMQCTIHHVSFIIVQFLSKSGMDFNLKKLCYR